MAKTAQLQAQLQTGRIWIGSIKSANEPKCSRMDSKEALEFINGRLWEKSQPVLTEAEEAIVIGIWQGNGYKQIAIQNYFNDQYTRELGSNLCQRIQTYFQLKINKRNFKRMLRISLHGGGQRMLRFCFMGEGEPSHKTASSIRENNTLSFFLSFFLVFLAPLSPGARGAGGEGVVA